MQGFFTPYVGVVGGLNTTCLVSEVAKPLSSVNTRKNTSVHKGFSDKIENHRALLSKLGLNLVILWQPGQQWKLASS